MKVRSMSATTPDGYKQTEVGLIPKDWEAKPVGDDIDLLTGFPFPSSGYSKSGVRLLRGSNVKRGETDWSEEITQYWPATNADIARYELRAGDVVIAMDGSLVGRSSAKIAATDLPALLLQRVARIRSTKGLDASYLNSFVRSDWFVKHTDAVKTVTAIPHISPADIRSFTIPIPPTTLEQRAIAAALSDVDALLAKLDALVAKKRDLKQATMQQLLSGQTRLPGFGGEWDRLYLGDLFTFKNGLNKARQFFGFGTPIVNYMDVFSNAGILCSKLQGLVSLSGPEIKNFDVKKGDVLFTRTSETPDEIGMAAVVLDDPRQTVFSGFVLRGRPRNDRLCDDFKAYCFRSSFVRRQIISKASYTTRALTNGRLLSGVVLPVPSLSEQTAIATVLADMDIELAALEARRDKTRALKQGMMQELLTGRIRLV